MTAPPTLLDRKVSLFSNARNPEPLEELSLREVLRRIENGQYEHAIEQVRRTEPRQQQEVKARVLPAFTPAGCFRYRNSDALVEHIGVGVLDFDDKTDPTGTKSRLSSDPHVLTAFESPRGGVKALVPITVTDPVTGEVRVPRDGAEHRAAMDAVLDHFGHENPDPSGTDVGRLCYVSVDRSVRVNEGAVPINVYLALARRPAVGADGNRRKEARQAPGTAVIPHGQQYTTLRQLTGAIHRLGIHGDIVKSMIGVVYHKHLEHPNNWPHVERMIEDITAKPVEPHTTARAEARRALIDLKKEGLLNEEAIMGGGSSDDAVMLPWLDFPVNLLPGSVRDYANAQAKAIGIDVAFVAAPVLAVLSAAVGNSFRLGIKRNWNESSTLWVVVVADSGSGKSPALEAALRPVYGLEAEAREAYEDEIAEFNALDKEERKAVSHPSRNRFRVGDTTSEGLLGVHAQNPRGIMLVRDEVGGWLGSFDKYSGGSSDLQTWIEVHGGRPITIDRKSSEKPTLDIERPHVSVTGTIQRGILQEQLSKAFVASGFLARLLLVEPPVRELRWTEADVTREVEAAYYRQVEALYAFSLSDNVLDVTPEAKTVFIDFANENAEMQHRLPSGPLKSALSKHQALALRFALIFHLAVYAVENRGENSPGPVSADAMQRGVCLARWFRYETARLYQKYGIEQQVLDHDTRLAAQLPDTFTWQDVQGTWGVQRSGAFRVIDRLVEKRLAEKIEHGSYRVLRENFMQAGPVNFEDFLEHPIHGQEDSGQSPWSTSRGGGKDGVAAGNSSVETSDEDVASDERDGNDVGVASDEESEPRADRSTPDEEKRYSTLVGGVLRQRRA